MERLMFKDRKGEGFLVERKNCQKGQDWGKEGSLENQR